VLVSSFARFVLWFAARRGGPWLYKRRRFTIDRPAPLVFRWITTDDLQRRWISDLVKLEKNWALPGQPNRAMFIG